MAEKIAKSTGGTLFQIEPSQPYTEADLDGWNQSARGTRESKDRSTRPAIRNKVDNFEKYDTVYLGFPIWWYTAPTIINTFLEGYDTAGKVIIPFATSGGSGYGQTEKDLRVSAPKAIFRRYRLLHQKYIPCKSVENLRCPRPQGFGSRMRKTVVGRKG